MIKRIGVILAVIIGVGLVTVLTNKATKESARKKELALFFDIIHKQHEEKGPGHKKLRDKVKKMNKDCPIEINETETINRISLTPDTLVYSYSSTGSHSREALETRKNTTLLNYVKEDQFTRSMIESGYIIRFVCGGHYYGNFGIAEFKPKTTPLN